tara:strand:- start:515 stop:817 length:303 start_codon:yes stop_codon:yes gene_type:complete
MVLRHLSTGVYWITFLYFINYTIDILIQIEKECKKKQMDNFMKIKCFLTNIKLIIGVLCCFITYYLAYYSPQFTKGSIADTVVSGIEKQIEKAAGIPTTK